MSENTKEKLSVKDRGLGLGGVFAVSVIFIALGLLLLFVPQIKPVYIAYVLSIAFVVVGIIWIVQYFLTESYRNINRYGFSAGTLFVILGICAMLKAEVISGYFLLCMGILILVMGVVKLQNALDLKALKDSTWKAVLGLALAVIICAVIVIMNPFRKTEDLARFTYIIMVADGIFSIISMLCLAIRLKKYEKNKDMENKDMEAEELSIPVEDIEAAAEPLAPGREEQEETENERQQ